MFDMFFGKKNKNKGQDGGKGKQQKQDNQKQVRQKIEKEEEAPLDLNTVRPVNDLEYGSAKLTDETTQLHGSRSRYRGDREALYNYQRLAKMGAIDHKNDEEYNQLAKAAQM